MEYRRDRLSRGLEKNTAKNLGRRELPPVEIKPWKGATKAARGIKVEGIDNLLIRFSKCCNPVPGDEIVGFITRGRGISIHCKDCPNVLKAGEKERLLKVYWQTDSDISYPVAIEITAMDRPNLLAEVMHAVSESKVNITAVNGRTTRDKIFIVNMTFVVRDLEHLEHIINKIKRVKDVFSVRRYAGASSPGK